MLFWTFLQKSNFVALCDKIAHENPVIMRRPRLSSFSGLEHNFVITWTRQFQNVDLTTFFIAFCGHDFLASDATSS